MRTRILRASGAAIALFACLGANQTAAADAGAFYKGATITVLCPFGAGGGYGRLTTLISKHLGKRIPGNPKVITQFMPGGGGIKMANYLYNVAPHNGTVMGLIYDGIPTAQLLYKDRGIKYKAEEFVPLGSLTAYDPGLLAVWKSAPVKSVAEAKKTEAILGAGGKGVNQYIIPNLLNQMVGTKFKIVLGYKGMSTIVTAMERHEVQGTLASYSIWKQMRPEWVKDNKLRWLGQMAMVRDKSLSDVPLLQELTSDKKYQDVFVFLTLGRTMTKSLMLPPGVPADRVAALRDGVMAMGKDEKFIAAARKQRIIIQARPWERVQKVVQATIDTRPDVIELTRSLISR